MGMRRRAISLSKGSTRGYPAPNAVGEQATGCLVSGIGIEYRQDLLTAVRAAGTVEGTRV